MKLLGRSPNGKMVKIGEDPKKDAKWYYIKDDMKPLLTELKDGDEVTIESKQIGGAFHLTFLAKGKVEITAKKEEKKEEKKTGAAPAEEKKEDKNKLEPGAQKVNPDKTGQSIERQVVIKSTAETLHALQGFITPENVLEQIEKISNKYIEVLKK